MRRPSPHFYAALGLVLAAITIGSSSSGQPAPATDELATLRSRVQELEAQSGACGQQVSTLQAENSVLRAALAQIATNQPPAPKGSVPFDFNGLRFYVMPAAPGQQATPSKR